MDQWQPYSAAAGGGARRFNNNPQQGQSHQAREYTSGTAPANFGQFEQYQGGVNAASASASQGQNTPHVRDGSGDVAMQDAGDPYNGVKYPMRPHHHQHLSAGGRSALHQSPQEQSSAAQRYSPMEALSSAAPYTTASQTSQNPYNTRQSPTRPGSYSSPNSYYSSRPQPQQLPPITPYSSANNQEAYPPSATSQLNAVFGNDVKSPRRPLPQAAPPSSGRGPVPQFTKVRAVSDLQPKINAQPAFRRANPEGGFISVSQESSWSPALLILHVAITSPHNTPSFDIPNMQSKLQI